jgi:hypothetical protein
MTRRRRWLTEPENHAWLVTCQARAEAEHQAALAGTGYRARVIEYAALGLPTGPTWFFPIFSIKEDVYR